MSLQGNIDLILKDLEIMHGGSTTSGSSSTSATNSQLTVGGTGNTYTQTGTWFVPSGLGGTSTWSNITVNAPITKEDVEQIMEPLIKLMAMFHEEIRELKKEIETLKKEDN